MWTTETCIYLFSHPVVSDSFWPMDCSTPGLPVPHHLLKLAQVHVHYLVMPSSHLIMLWCPLLLLPSIFPSIGDFSNELSVCIRWPKYWNFSFSISPSKEYSGLISLKIDCFDLAVQGTLRSLLQHHGLKASILQCSLHSLQSCSHNYTWPLGRP